MENLTMRLNLWNRYNKIAFAHRYIVGWTFNKVVYFAVLPADSMGNFISLDRASRGAGYAIRFSPRKVEKIALLSQNSQILCSESYFLELLTKSKYNAGELFEKLITEHFGQEWTKDNVPFTKDGDITINNVPYQIKYQKATFTNEKSLTRLEQQGL